MSRTVVRDTGIHLFGRPLGLVLLVLYKGVWGTFEVLAGTFVLLSYRIFTEELTEDPQDLLAKWLFAHLGVAQAHRLGTVIILFGAIKIMLAFGVWYRSWLIRNIALAFFGAVAAFGVYEISLKFTVFRSAALAVDLSFIYYFWKILPKHLHHGEVS